MSEYENIWSFETANFRVNLDATPDYDLDLSWDEDGEVRDRLENGVYCAFIARVRVIHLETEVELGVDYLGGCIYESPSAFKGDGYFRDMVREAIRGAREEVAKLRAIHLRAA